MPTSPPWFRRTVLATLLVAGNMIGSGIFLLPVSVAPDYSVAIHQFIRNIGPLKQVPCDVGAVPHDMGLHAAALHAIPETAWQQILERAFEQIRARPLQVLAGRFGSP